jgi:hypothetical protein
MPVELFIHLPKQRELNVNDNDEGAFIDKFVWNPSNAQSFKDSFDSDEARTKLENAINMIDVDVNNALHAFNESIKKMAECMKKRIFLNRPKKSHEWFDFDCSTNRRNVRKLLRKFRHTLNADDRNAFCIARREYKNLLKKKKKQYNDTLLNMLLDSVKNQRDFWDAVHKISFKRKNVRNNIHVDDWYKHFRALLEKDVNTDDTTENTNVDDNHTLNRPISEAEVLLALRKLKPRKAAGPDGIIGEIIKHSGNQVTDFFVKFFNTLFDKGIFPDIWTESIVIPLLKKGDVNNPSNYRGISLCDTSSKLYSTIINNRLQEWVEENNITGEYQAGFKRGYSTIDHMFTLLACVQKQFAANRKLYVAFIDFEKAFDSINRNLLWPILLKNGIQGKLFRCIKNMYNNVKARVRCGAKLTDYVNCTAGVKQGDVCSPILFSLFINELSVEVINKGRHGATFMLDALELFILLLADDVILMSETVIGLQTQLNNLQHAACELDLKVNMNKSNIIVFRKGGYLGARERWVFSGAVMPVANVYKYLGIYFTTRLSFVSACKDLASRAKNALLCILQKLYMLNVTVQKVAVIIHWDYYFF